MSGLHQSAHQSAQSLADRLARALAGAGATTMFGLPGGGPNLDMIGAGERHGLRFVLAHGETAAAIMAATHGLLTGQPSPVIVTRGPGAASLTNGLAQATLDRYPLMAVTDTVPAKVRPRVAHQRIDQRSMLGPVSKISTIVSDATGDDELAELAADSLTWPYGAIHIDFDPSAGAGPPAPTEHAGPRLVDPPTAIDETEIAPARRILADASSPVVIVGMEAAAVAYRQPGDGGLRAALPALGCPILTTYQAIGTVPSECGANAGLFTNGELERPVLEAADVILTVGLDLVEPIPADWSYDVPVIRLSAVRQLDDYLPATVDLVGDVTANLAALIDGLDPRWSWEPDAADCFRQAGRARLIDTKRGDTEPGDTEPGHDEPGGGDAPVGLGPIEVVAELRAAVPSEATVTVDAGAHFLAVMPLWPVERPFGLLISNGLATMGFAIPAAIGAALARPGQPVLALTGDGGLAMTLAELETIGRLGLPVTVVVFNDSALSLIEIKQRAEHGGPAAVRYRPVDFAAIAVAQGVEAEVVSSVTDLRRVLAADDAGGSAGDRWRRPRLIDARVDPSVYRHLITTTRG